MIGHCIHKIITHIIAAIFIIKSCKCGTKGCITCQAEKAAMVPTDMKPSSTTEPCDGPQDEVKPDHTKSLKSDNEGSGTVGARDLCRLK